MVRNIHGGSGAKSLARKDTTKCSNQLRTSQDVLEQYACVTKMLGNGMCEIYTNDRKRYLGHIRNKFSGKQKRHNMIYPFSIVLVGMREWESPKKNCDIIAIYEDSHVEQLASLPSIDIRTLLHIRNVKSPDIMDIGGGGMGEEHIYFEEGEGHTKKEKGKEKEEEEEFTIEKMEDIHIDDI